MSVETITPFEHPEFDNHEQVIFCRDEDAGVSAIIAIHDTTLGPAAGGCRMYPYPSSEAALTDVLRLSQGMTYKSACAGLPLGGGKCVIIADSRDGKKPERLRAFSKFVQKLNGQYWTAMDVGVGPEDADILAENCDYIFTRASQYPQGFSPSLFTSLGGFAGIRGAVRHVMQTKDLRGVRVAIQGVGNTGRELCRMLKDEGAELVVSDVNDEAVQFVVDKYGATAVGVDDIYSADVDIFSPCALGGIINDDTIPQLKAKAVCGLANNQLERPEHGAALMKKGIAYAPDFVVNAGGMIGASTVIFTTPDQKKSEEQIRDIENLVAQILERAEEESVPPSEIAVQMAKERIAKGS